MNSFWLPPGSPATQRPKTSALSPNPLEPARSKRSLPFSTKHRNVIENASTSGTFFYYLWYLFRDFFQKLAKGVQGAAPKCYKDTKMDPKGAHMAPKGAQMVPKWSPRVPKWAPKVTQSAQRTPKATPKCH